MPSKRKSASKDTTSPRIVQTGGVKEMRAVVQRVREASVSIEGQTVGEIGKGLVILLGVAQGDSEREARY